MNSLLRAAQALGPLILAEALRRHAASPVADTRPVGVFGMSFDSSIKMINFFRKRLAPYCFSTYESRASVKTLEVTRETGTLGIGTEGLGL